MDDRLATILAHLVAGNQTGGPHEQDSGLDLGKFEQAVMRQFVDKHDIEYRDWMISEFDASGLFRFDTVHLPMEEQRKLAWGRLKLLVQCKLQPISKPQPFVPFLLHLKKKTPKKKQTFDDEVMMKNNRTVAQAFSTWASAETFLLYDHSMSTLAGVQFTLFCGSLVNLGTARHKEYFEKALRLEIPGCFAVTELGQSHHETHSLSLFMFY